MKKIILIIVSLFGISAFAGNSVIVEKDNILLDYLNNSGLEIKKSELYQYLESLKHNDIQKISKDLDMDPSEIYNLSNINIERGGGKEL